MSRRAARHGFTLIELLVVLGILVLLSTIGVAAFISSGKVNRLVATEQLIAAQVRQARYTARATGQAVLIYIDKDANTISGVSRIPIWQGSCEAPYVALPAAPATPTSADQPPFDMNATPVIDRAKFLVANGRSGTGFGRLNGTSDVASSLLAASTGPTRNRQLTRSSTKPTEGFSLSCAVRPKRIASTDTVQPLIVIGPDAVASHPDADTAFAGIILRAKALPMYASGAPLTPSAAFSPITVPNITAAGAMVNPNRWCWDIRGWVMPEAGAGPVFISSILDADVGTADDLNFLVSSDDGGKWEDITFIYTGLSLELYRNGIRIANKAVGVPARVAGYNQAHRLYLGSAIIGGTTHTSDATTILDDIALFRLGTDQPTGFAPGVEAAATYRLLVRPDGRMTEEVAGNSSLINLTFSGVFAEKEDQAIISITAGTGLVNSSKVVLSKSAP